MNDFDDIDRALFALPLETPPADLRERILAATVRAPYVAAAPVLRPIDVALVALLAVLCLGSVAASLFVPGFAAGILAAVTHASGAFANPMLWLWLAVGGSVAAWLNLFEFVPVRLRVRS